MSECQFGRVIPVTAHASFDKGAAYMGVKIHTIPVDPVMRKVDIQCMGIAMCVCSRTFLMH